MKEQLFNYILENKKMWNKAMTKAKLIKIKSLFMNDIRVEMELQRHNFDIKNEHLISNIISIIREIILTGVIY